MNASPALLALVPTGGYTGFLENLSFQAAGLAVVLLSLGLLAAVVALAGRILPSGAQKPPAPLRSAAAPFGGGLAPETLAIIAAAVSVSIPGAHRILRIRPNIDLRMEAWSLEGRRQIFQSHRPR